MADIDLKELGILQEPQWWEPFLNIGMIIAAFFQAVCIGFAVFGPDSSDSGKILQVVGSGNLLIINMTFSIFFRIPNLPP
jgi:hypothetical protein